MSEEIIKYISKKMQEKWDKMGNTGAGDYWETADRHEIWEFGYFRALEDLTWRLEKLGIDFDWTEKIENQPNYSHNEAIEIAIKSNYPVHFDENN